MGSIRCHGVVPRAAAHVRQVRHLRHALTRVALAVPRGAMRAVNAWLKDSTVTGVARASRAMYGS